MIEIGKKRDREAMISTTGAAIVISGFASAKVLNSNDRTLALPLIELAKAGYSMVMPRTFVRGRSSSGGSYGQFSQTVPEKGFWVPPSRPHPPGADYAISSGSHAGWKVYKSPSAYREAMGQTSKRFVLTGRAARSYKVKPMGPTRVKLAASGGRGKGQPTNAKLMGILARRGRKSPIRPSAAEVKKLGILAMSILTPQLIESAYWSQLALAARKKLAGRQRGLETLKRSERKARAKINAPGSR